MNYSNEVQVKNQVFAYQPKQIFLKLVVLSGLTVFTIEAVKLNKIKWIETFDLEFTK